MPTVASPPPSQALLSPGDLETLRTVRSDAPRLVFAVDTEFHYPRPNGDERMVLTYQFAFVDPAAPDEVREVVFYSLAGWRVPLHRAIAYLVERFGLAASMRCEGATKCPDGGYRYEQTRRWIVPTVDLKGAGWDDRAENPDNWEEFASFDEALNACGDPDFLDAYRELQRRYKQPERHKLAFDDETYEPFELAGYVNEFGGFHRDKRGIPVTVLCHAGKADLTAFSFDAHDYEKDVLLRVSDVQGGLVTQQSYTANPHLVTRYWQFYPLNVNVRDTMCYAPAKMKKLEQLGEAVGVPKLDIPDGYSKDAMHVLLQGDPVAFMEYAAQDALVTLVYASALYGWNRAMPITASAAAASAVKSSIKRYYGVTSNADFNRQWRGLQSSEVMVRDPRTGAIGPKKELVPVNDQARILLEYARNSFKGGANGCSFVGWVYGGTDDVDLCGAYPLGMACVPDVDWEAVKSIAREWVREDALLQDFHSPFDPAFFYVDDFEFPDSVPYPCIAMNINGSIVFPRRLGERDGVYCTGVEVWLALRMGARVHVQHGYVGRIRMDADGRPSHSLFHAAKAMVGDRDLLKRAIKAGQTELAVFEQLTKTMVNSVYGKTAQNVIEKQTWDALKGDMVDLGMSSITSPVHASMITAIVRCALFAAMNELHLMGYRSFSFTTDGFITDADAAVVDGLPMYGLGDYLRAARMALVGSDTIWEGKHRQDGFYNLTTRGNMAPNMDGVIAHNSYVSPHDVGTLEDRLYCLDEWLTRTGKCDCTHNAWVQFRKLADRQLREDFHTYDQLRSISMDYDCKRKPVESSVTTAHPVIEGRVYEVANVETVPYDTPEEYEFFRARARSMKCLRTEAEWKLFFARAKAGGSGVQRHVRDWEWSRLFTCVMGHRLGLWSIPALDDPALTVEAKCKWVNGFNSSSKEFKPNNWKDARKQNRQSQMLPRDDVADLLAAMGAVDCAVVVED